MSIPGSRVESPSTSTDHVDLLKILAIMISKECYDVMSICASNVLVGRGMRNTAEWPKLSYKIRTVSDS